MISNYRKRIALERIEILFNEAKRAMKLKKPELAKRYIELARKIGMRCNVKIPSQYKTKFCKKCNVYLIPSKNCKIKLDSKKHLIKITCLECGNIKIFRYKK
ncbi:MAG: ribonuclease P [Candidatus Aenigmatarchaeota archaeon]|nr:ribonuclease P [Candidatus Aenigmarchaeota archaeon]